MQLLTYKNAAGEYRAGVKLDQGIFDAQLLMARPDCASILPILERWDEMEPLLIQQVNQRITST